MRINPIFLISLFLLSTPILSFAQKPGGCASTANFNFRAQSDRFFNPCTLRKEVPDKNVKTIVYFAAHPDDETIAIAGDIAKELANSGSSTQVIVEMMTDGHGSNAQGKIRAKGHDLTDDEFGDARVREFVAAMKALTVDKIKFNNNNSMSLHKDQVKARIDWYKNNFPNVEFVGTAGKELDTFHHPDHQAIFDALNETADINKKWFLVYIYGHHSRKTSQYAQILTAKECLEKRKALKEYEVWDPKMGRFAIGWTHSTPDLFENAFKECKEYVVTKSKTASSDCAGNCAPNTPIPSRLPVPIKKEELGLFDKILKFFKD